MRSRNRRDRERSDLASDGAGAGGYSLDRGSTESVLQRPEERALKKHSSRESSGASGPRSPHLRPEEREIPAYGGGTWSEQKRPRVERSGGGRRWAGGRSLDRGSAEGVQRRPERNTAARRRAEPVGPDRRTIFTYARSRGKKNTGPNTLDT
ncbi:hypothetical protein NDU88_004791 [Pleurodeles waltl]|uniref:Uncharacterized protein n=1 Tax=Pleurodeles waltl TaxID=8319 RepID=A0AAV7PDK6_PLEWA|nr:hypothetical protein NDU88_004791 [Pleurodeles waltl]